MKKNLIMTSFTLLFSTIFSRGGNNIVAEAAEPVVDAQTVSNQENGLDTSAIDLSIQDFSYQFFAQNLDSENPVLSPVSAYLALSMVGLGAEGTTQTEFVNVLGNDMAAASGELMSLFPKNSENTKVSLANSAWLANQFTVNDSWLNEITYLMDAEAVQADLSSPEIVGSMNNWIEKQTNGLIEDMITEPFSTDTMLVLFNTVYFKAKWESPFAVHSTFEDKFTLENRKSISVPMMHKNVADMKYISNDMIEGLIFPYRKWTDADGNFAMIALKPSNNKTGKNKDIRELYSELTTEVISDLLKNTQTKTVNTMLPKFEITFDKDLNQSLQNMGLKEAFEPNKANLSRLGISENGNNLYIDLVRQKAKIIVDEDGTEAAAATEVATRYAAVRKQQKPIDVFFNEPFLYIIMDMDKEIPLFIGILDNPAA